MTTATISQNEIRVAYFDARSYKTFGPQDKFEYLFNSEYLIVNIPNGYDDVKKIQEKVLTHDSKKFVFTCWDSDALKCYFIRGKNFATVS